MLRPTWPTAHPWVLYSFTSSSLYTFSAAAASPAQLPAAVAQLLLEFPDVVNPSKQLPAAVHDVFHHIKTVGPPLASRFLPLRARQAAGGQSRI